MNQGYIKLHRKILDNPVVCKDADHLAVWTYLLLNATHKNVDVMFGGKRITLKYGQLTTGRKIISEKLGISESKVQRILKCFESEQQIEQRTDRQCRLITICSWNKYQVSEQRNEQRVNNDRTTSEQRVNTKQECKNDKNVKNVINSSGCWSADDGLIMRLNKQEVEKLKQTYDDYLNLIVKVSDEVVLKGVLVEKPYQYIVGYAEKTRWRKNEQIS